MEQLTQERLKQLIIYEPETGTFTKILELHEPWVKTKFKAKPGQRLKLRIDGESILAHRAAFLYMTGMIPEIIDHIDGDPGNNSWGNLRAATHAQNMQNRKTPSHNSSGVKGVRFRNGKYRAYVTGNGRSVYKTFDDLENATNWVKQERQKLHGAFAKD